MTKFEQRVTRTTARVMKNPKIVLGWYAGLFVFATGLVWTFDQLMK